MNKEFAKTVLSDVKTAYLLWENENYKNRLREAYNYLKAEGINSLEDFNNREGLKVGAFTYEEMTIFDRIDNDREYLMMLLSTFHICSELQTQKNAKNPTYGDELASWGTLNNTQSR